MYDSMCIAQSPAKQRAPTIHQYRRFRCSWRNIPRIRIRITRTAVWIVARPTEEVRRLFDRHSLALLVTITLSLSQRHREKGCDKHPFLSAETNSTWRKFCLPLRIAACSAPAGIPSGYGEVVPPRMISCMARTGHAGVTVWLLCIGITIIIAAPSSNYSPRHVFPHRVI